MGGLLKVCLAVGVVSTLSPWAAIAQNLEQQAMWNKIHTRAITGDRLLFKGSELKLRNLACPNLEAEAGLRAKALLNTFLRRAGAFTCSYQVGETGVSWARCNVAERNGLKGKDIAQGMRDSGLCEWAADVDATGT